MKPDRMIKLPEVLNLTKKSKSAIRRDIEAGVFPAPVKIGARSIAWKHSEVMGWFDTRERAENYVH